MNHTESVPEMLNLFTDSRAYAQYLWPGLQGFSETKLEGHAAVTLLLSDEELLGSEAEFSPPWRCLVVTPHSTSSQFETLRGILQKSRDLPDGFVSVSGSGDGFIGYHNRGWVSIPGNLHMTAFLRPMTSAPEMYPGMIIIAALSVIQAIDGVPGLEGKAGIRWINDILIDSKKVAGVITHTQSQGNRMTGVLFGIGINVESRPDVVPDRFVPEVACLNDFTDPMHACRLPDFLGKFLCTLGENYQSLVAGQFEKYLALYRSRSVIMGRDVDVYSDPLNGSSQYIASGTVRDISDRLELLIEGYGAPFNRGRVVLKT